MLKTSPIDGILGLEWPRVWFKICHEAINLIKIFVEGIFEFFGCKWSPETSLVFEKLGLWRTQVEKVWIKSCRKMTGKGKTTISFFIKHWKFFNFILASKLKKLIKIFFHDSTLWDIRLFRQALAISKHPHLLKWF